MPNSRMRNTRPAIECRNSRILSMLHIHCNGQHVALVSYCLDDAWRVGVVCQLLPQAAYLQIDRPVKRLRRATAGEIHELLAIQHRVRIGDKRFEESELRTRKRNDEPLFGH